MENYNFSLLFLSLWGGFGNFAGRGETRHFGSRGIFKNMGLISQRFNDWFTDPNYNDFRLSWDLSHNLTLRLVCHVHIRNVMEGDRASVSIHVTEQTPLVYLTLIILTLKVT